MRARVDWGEAAGARLASPSGMGTTAGLERALHMQGSLALAERDPPLARAESGEHAESLIRRAAAPRVIVYIEESASDIALMRGVLEELRDVLLFTVPTGELGLEVVRGHQPDLVIMELHLPGMSGIATARQLRQWPETRDIPMVLLGAAAKLRERQFRDGVLFARCLTKPLHIGQLTAALEELLPGVYEPERPP